MCQLKHGHFSCVFLPLAVAVAVATAATAATTAAAACEIACVAFVCWPTTFGPVRSCTASNVLRAGELAYYDQLWCRTSHWDLV